MDWDAADNSDSNSDIDFTPFNVVKRKQRTRGLSFAIDDSSSSTIGNKNSDHVKNHEGILKEVLSEEYSVVKFQIIESSQK